MTSSHRYSGPEYSGLEYSGLEPIDLAAAAKMLSEASHVWVGTHLDPDGDAIGALLGLGWMLAASGKEVWLACQDAPPGDLDHLPGREKIGATPLAEVVDRIDLAVAVDAAAVDRLGRLLDGADWASFPSLVIDHHASNPGFGRRNLIDPTKASTCEIVLALAEAWGIPLDAEPATCLLAGVVTDTNGFRTSNTEARTLDAARRLMELGADLQGIMRAAFANRPLGSLLLTGRALARLEVRGKYGVASLRLADMHELGVTSAEARGVVAFLATADLAAVGLVREREDGLIDVSLRSQPGVDLVPVSLALGGGGHPQAAGARLNGSLDEAVRELWAALGAPPRRCSRGSTGRPW